jgi:tetratricopeptide (TPR) repeat protein
MVVRGGRSAFAAVCILFSQPAAAQGQHTDLPVAILTRIDAPPVEIDRGDQTTRRTAEVGELILADERVRGYGVVVECKGPASRQWFPDADSFYIGGKGVPGSTRNPPAPQCRMPEETPTAKQADIDLHTADELADQLARSNASTTDTDPSQLKDLPSYDPNDGLSVLRRAQALEDREQLGAAILIYMHLAEVWKKAPWVWPKIWRLRIAFARKLLEAGPAPGIGHITPMVIGVSNYLREDPNFRALHYAHLDGQAFASYLESVDPERKVQPLINDGATLSAIITQLSSIQSRAKDRSTAVVFVSAHGWQDPFRAYIAPYDAEFQVAKDTGVPVTAILSAVCAFQRAVVFVDACRTPVSRRKSETSTTPDGYDGPWYDQNGAPAPTGKTFLVSSSGPGTPSAEGPQFRDDRGALAQAGHGAFTYHLLKLLYLNAGSQARPISRGELRSDLLAAMKDLPQAPDLSGNMLETDRLDPLKRVPMKVGTGPTSLLDWFRASFRLAAYSPDQQAEITPQAIDQMRTILGRGAITTLAARQAVAAYAQLSPANRRLVGHTIRIALEDEGERLLLNYLHGYEVEPPRSQFTDANEYYTLARQLAPNSLLLGARAEFNAGRALLFDFVDPAKRKQRDSIYADAVSHLFDAYRQDPGPYILNALGIAFMERGEWDKAIPAFDDASRLAPAWLYPKQNRALTLMRSGRARAAIDEYRNAIAQMPSAHTLHFNLALVYQQTNRLKEAEREYAETERWLKKATAASQADWARLYNAQGTLEAQRGRRRAAEKLYAKAQKTAPLPETLHNLALISKPEVEERLLRQNRGYLNSRIELAQIYKRSGRVNDAVAEYKAILEERDDFAGAHLDLAQLCLRDEIPVPERLKLANEQLALAANAGTGFWKVYLVKAEEFRLQKDDTQAKANYREARNRAPDRDARREISESEKGKWVH